MTSPVYPSTHSLNPTHDYLVALAHETATCLSSNARKVLSHINNGQETVDLSDIVISGNDLQHIANNISELKNIKNLDLSHTKLDAVGVRAVIKICTEPSMLKCINLHNCGLDETLLKVLAEKGKIISPVEELILSSNHGIGDSVEIVTAIADKFNCEVIDISANALDGEHFDALASADAPAKVHTIRVCENPIDTWDSLAMLVKKWNIKTLDASYCIMYLEDAQNFVTALGGYRLSSLDLHHPDLCAPLAKKLRELLKDISYSLNLDSTDDA